MAATRLCSESSSNAMIQRLLRLSKKQRGSLGRKIAREKKYTQEVSSEAALKLGGKDLSSGSTALESQAAGLPGPRKPRKNSTMDSGRTDV